MAKWKLPPIAKTYEAMSAVADNRVIILEDGKAEVTSSSGDKKYIVEWKNGNHFTSNDNASYWQGYLGYPIIAVLIKLGEITSKEETLKKLSGIHWKSLNKEHKNNYDKAVASVLDRLAAEGHQKSLFIDEAKSIFDQLSALALEKISSKNKPPKA